MTESRRYRVCVCALLGTLVGCVTHQHADRHQQAYQNGQEAAAKEIAEGAPTLYGFAFGGGPPVDAKTGLSMIWLTNDLREAGVEEYVRGHNDYILRHLAKPPGHQTLSTTRTGRNVY